MPRELLNSLSKCKDMLQQRRSLCYISIYNRLSGRHQTPASIYAGLEKRLGIRFSSQHSNKSQFQSELAFL